MPPELLDVLDACPGAQGLGHAPPGPPSPTSRGARDKALLLVGFVGALRRSELVALDFDDVNDHAMGLVVTIPRSKTNQEGTEPGIDPRPYSAHSLRAGFVTYADLRGASDRAIAHQTRHRSMATLGQYARVDEAGRTTPLPSLGGSGDEGLGKRPSTRSDPAALREPDLVKVRQDRRYAEAKPRQPVPQRRRRPQLSEKYSARGA